MSVSNLLAIDFDMFFPNPFGDPGEKGRDWTLYDWGHAEAPFFIDFVWSSRAEGFVLRDRPLPDLNGQERTFWQRPWKISKRAKLYFADSNACAVDPRVTGQRREWGHVYLYDAHHDSGYHGGGIKEARRLVSEGTWDCSDWMVLYRALGARLHVRYPQWRAWAMDAEPAPIVPVDRAVDDGSVPDVTFDHVFICRSGAWVPPWRDIDAKFAAFVSRFELLAGPATDLQPGGTTPREFDIAWAQESVANLRQTFPEHFSTPKENP